MAIELKPNGDGNPSVTFRATNGRMVTTDLGTLAITGKSGRSFPSSTALAEARRAYDKILHKRWEARHGK